MRRTLPAVMGLFGLLSFPACLNSGVDGERPERQGCGPIDTPEPDPVECDGGLLITELMPKPGSGADYEWFVMLRSPTSALTPPRIITRAPRRRAQPPPPRGGGLRPGVGRHRMPY